jgi:hypothetical protein
MQFDLSNSTGLQCVSFIHEQGRDRQEVYGDRSPHGSSDLCLHADINELQAGRGRSLQAAREKEILEGSENDWGLAPHIPLLPPLPREWIIRQQSSA